MNAPSRDAKFTIVQVNDVHLDVTTPARRTDNYHDAVMQKLLDVRDYCNAHEVHAVAFTGDLFNKPEGSRVPHRLVSELVAYFAGFRPGLPVFMVPGNHDLLMRPVLDNQPIRSIYEAGRVVNPGDGMVVERNGIAVNFAGGLYYDDIDVDRRGYHMKRDPEALWNVKLAHGMLLPDGMKFFDRWTNPVDLLDFEGDVILVGHYHDFLGIFGSVPRPGRMPILCVNYGSLSRGSISGYRDDRMPVFCTIELGPYPQIKTEAVIPASARNFVEVFAVEDYEAEKVAASRMEEVVQSISTMAQQGFGQRSIDAMVDDAVAGCSDAVTVLVRGFVKKAQGVA